MNNFVRIRFLTDIPENQILNLSIQFQIEF
jgi:hypothetical protein